MSLSIFLLWLVNIPLLAQCLAVPDVRGTTISFIYTFAQEITKNKHELYMYIHECSFI
jgi:hypothetical protein